MNTLHATSKTPAYIEVAGAINSRAANPLTANPNRAHERRDELTAWISMAVIWGLSGIALYVLWVKASGSL